ncbi:SirB2 family protein [Shewanella litorisediminis]|uniref:SirB2 family protein n=1 Tax=Shewanella litorisediminis TaxID=1173586 RepID=A0ABX7G0V3_9GAMM|nr:SirB2 family protein [Shewanella litorisediminis]MCL2918093.1 SirB2 family protein [Shewanella litorisediminis]QRH00847.1 SirB2 family protein [Shewanella litorisediminis]
MESINNLYPVFKHLHLTLVAISVIFFVVRFVLKLRESALLQKKVMRIAPHIIDTCLLLSGLLMCFLIKQYPFVDPWLTEKILAVVAYILLAIMAMKSNRNKFFRFFAFLGAIAWVVYAAKIAVFKQAIMLAS